LSLKDTIECDNSEKSDFSGGCNGYLKDELDKWDKLEGVHLLEKKDISN